MLEDQGLRNVLVLQAVATVVLIAGLATAIAGVSDSGDKEGNAFGVERAVEASAADSPRVASSAGIEAE